MEPGPGGVEFEVLLPIGGGSAPEAVAHMHGDEAAFLEALGDVMQSNSSEAALLATPIAASLSGLQTEDVQAVLDSLGGAVVRGIVPLPTAAVIMRHPPIDRRRRRSHRSRSAPGHLRRRPGVHAHQSS